MNKTEFTPLNRQERKTELERYQEYSKNLEFKTRQLNNRINELETAIERHLYGWCIVAIIIVLIFIVNIAT